MGATAADCPFVAKQKLVKMAAKNSVDPMRPLAQLDVAPMPTGTAAQITSTVLLLLLTVLLLPSRSWLRWLPRNSVDPMRHLAQLDVAPMPTGTVAQITSTVLLLLLTVPLLLNI